MSRATGRGAGTSRTAASIVLASTALLLAVAVVVPAVGAQEPTGSDQVVCPSAPLQAAGRNFGASPLEGPGPIDLRCADLQGAVFPGTDLTQADLRGANLSRATFDGATLVQTDLAGAVLRDTTIADSNLGQAELLGADLRGVRIRNSELTQVELPGADLVEAQLVDVDLGQADLTGARLVGADLTDAQLSQTVLVGADLNDAVLRDAVFTQTRLERARLAGADLSGATAIQSDFVRADLRRANLTNASFAQSDLRGADLTDAVVSGADFAGADLTDARIDQVVGADSPFPRAAWVAVGLGALLVALSVVGLVVRIVRRRTGPPNPYDTPLTPANTIASFALVPAMACVQAVGLYLVVCSITGLISSGLNPLGAQQGAPFIGDLAFRPETIVVGCFLMVGGGIGRSVGCRI